MAELGAVILVSVVGRPDWCEENAEVCLEFLQGMSAQRRWKPK